MTDFWTTTNIKATRKQHRCEWCGHTISVGHPAIRSSGVFDGEFQSRIAHTDCEEAVIQHHKICGMYGDDDLVDLSEIAGDRDNWPWLLEEFPAVAERFGVQKLMDEETPR